MAGTARRGPVSETHHVAEKKPKRDLHGRWVKGVSGNPNGRPHKYARVDTGDLDKFFGTTIEVKNPDGRMTIMTREAAILHRLYQSAMKGNVHAQIFLSRRFDKHYMDKAGVFLEFHLMMNKIRERDRKPTELEWAFIEGALDQLDP